jgi:ribosomal-protein-alanine N-acetyltransferase
MTEADLAGVAAIENESFSPWSEALLAQELEVSASIQLVAESSGHQLAGWCACRVICPEAELLKIAVKKKNRERGIGRFLLEYLFGELQKRNVTSLFLEVRSNNRTAFNFYERHGFFCVGSRPGYYVDPPDSAMILRKNLS